jgi:hypothetical protein
VCEHLTFSFMLIPAQLPPHAKETRNFISFTFSLLMDFTISHSPHAAD